MIGGQMKKIIKKDLFILLTMWLSPATILLLVISIYLVQPKVEAKLVSSVQSVLAEHHIDAEVSFSGRDGTLRGEVRSQEIADNAQKLSLAVFGIRVIHNQLLIRGQPYSASNKASETNNELPLPVIEKISYRIDPQQDIDETVNQEPEIIERKVEKPQYSSDVERIMATMQQQVMPITQPHPEKTSSIIVPLDDELVEHHEVQKDKILEVAVAHSEPVKVLKKQVKQNQPNKSTNNLLNIIDEFNSSLGSFVDSSVEKEKEVSQNASVTPQEIDKIDLSSIQFSNNSTTLPLVAHQILDKVAASIKIQSYPNIELIAYANDSDIAYARGVSIREYLATQGINKNSIYVSGYTITDAKNNTVAFEIRTYTD